MRILITGAGGLLGTAACRVLPALGFDVHARTHAQLDVTRAEDVREVLHTLRPNVVLNCAGFTRVDDAETRPADAMAVNAHAAALLAEECARLGSRIVYPSTDYVFAGDAQQPYRPSDEPAPINTYGRSKAAGEAATRAVPDHLIVRISWLFGAGGPNFVRTIAQRVQQNQPSKVVNDQIGRLTYARDAAVAIGQLLITEAPPGTWHVANGGQASWYDVACAIAAQYGRAGLITPCSSSDYPRAAKRPAYSVLDTAETDKRIGALRPWQDALAQALAERDF